MIRRMRFSVLLLLFGIMASSAFAQTSKYKCLLQLANYEGKGAYVVLSLIDAKGNYEKTLYMVGDDEKWYNTLPKWFIFHSGNSDASLDGITGATVTGGNRSVINVEIDDAKLNKGYKLRFETAVESQQYYTNDVEMPLNDEALGMKTNGTGYIRYVRFGKIE